MGRHDAVRAVALDGGLQCCDVLSVDGLNDDSPASEELIELGIRSAINIVTDHDAVAGLENAQHRVDRRETGGERKTTRSLLELGDLLFQVVFYAQMAQEEGRFNFEDICAAISDKLERRHPHIFADATAGNSSEVLARWEQIKSAERAEKAQHSALDDIPHSLPALMRAHKIQRRCSAVGFDWTSLGPVLDKVHEEIDEVMYEAQQAVVDEAKLEEEVGDLLFATVNLSRHLGVKAEVALQKANLKFERRFREVERIVAARGLEMTGIDLDTMEEVWQEVKRQETDL